MPAPLVSIIIPVYNSEKHLADCIDSVLAQTWPHKEIIIVDDGSTDSSLSIVQRYAGHPGVSIISQKNKGASAARNAGLKAAKGDYIQFLDADDLLSPDKIEAQITCLKGSRSLLAICKTVHFTDGSPCSNGEQTDEWFYSGSTDTVDFLTKLYAGADVLPGYGGMITIHSWLSPKKIIDIAGLWNEELTVDDDGEFFCRVVLASGGIAFCSTGLNYYRKFNSGRSLSSQKTRKAVASAILATDLKIAHLKKKTSDEMVDRVFAKHYWWAGVAAYPQFKDISAYCIKKAKDLGYSGEKYVGGPAGHFLTGLLGWKAARIISWCRQIFKQTWA